MFTSKHNNAISKAISILLSITTTFSLVRLVASDNDAQAAQGISVFEVDANHSSIYPIDTDNVYTTSPFPSGEFSESRFIITDSDGVSYIAFCAEYHNPPPLVDDHSVTGEAVNRESALAVAVASPNYGAMLTDSEFNTLFGLSGVTGYLRLMLINCFVWGMESTGKIDMAIGYEDWDTPELEQYALADLKKQMIDLGIEEKYQKFARGIKSMLSFYAGSDGGDGGDGGIASLSPDYDETTGALALGYAGYGAGSASFTLNVAGGSGIQVYKNGARVTALPVAITASDKIYIYGSGDLNISIKLSSPLILASGSIQGDRLENLLDNTLQDLITGFAQFGSLSSRITAPGAGTKSYEIPFTKIFAISSGEPSDASFRFTIAEVTSTGGAVSGGFGGSVTVPYKADENPDLSPFSFVVTGLAPAGAAAGSPRYYYYRIDEASLPVGWKNSHTRIFARVGVSETGQTTLHYYSGNSIDSNTNWASTATNTSTFTNTYSAHNNVPFTARKSVVGAWLGSAKSFGVKLTLMEEDPDHPGDLTKLRAVAGDDAYSETQSISVSGSGKTGSVNFASLDFALEGTYYCKIEETRAAEANWHYDSAYYIAKVVVTLNGSKYSNSVTYYKNGVDEVTAASDVNRFTNYYLGADFSGDFRKRITGTYLGLSHSFSFHMREVEADGSPVGTGAWTSLPPISTSGSSVSASFKHYLTGIGASAGTHYFEIMETGSTAGFTNDSGRLIVKVEIEDVLVPGTENTYYKSISVTSPYTGESFSGAKSSNLFSNAYNFFDENVPISKAVVGSNTYRNFAFDIVQAEENGEIMNPPTRPPQPPSLTIRARQSSGPVAGYIQLRGLTAGSYYYKVTERSTADEGWEYDLAPRFLRVLVVQEGNSLKATNSWYVPDGFPGASADNTFTNVYTLIDTDIPITKTVVGYDVNRTYQFRVSQADESGNPNGTFVPRPAQPSTLSITANCNSSINQRTAYIQLVNLSEGDYYYKVTETGTSDKGWTYDTAPRFLHVSAALVGDALKVSYDWYIPEGFSDAKDDPNFTNTYNLCDTNIVINKSVTGRRNPGYTDRQYTFAVAEVDENGAAPDPLPMTIPQNHRIVTTASLAANSSNNAGTKTATIQLRGLEAGCYYYKVTEVIPKNPSYNMSGWSYDEAPLYLKVTVVKNIEGSGFITTVEPFAPEGVANAKVADRTFHNSFYLGSATLYFTKKYTDANYPQVSFDYVLTPLEDGGRENPTQMAPSADGKTASSTGPGLKSFTLSNLAPGTYYYRIKERPNATYSRWHFGVNVLYARVKVTTGSSTVQWWDGTAWVSDSTAARSEDYRTITNEYTFLSKSIGAITIGGVKRITGVTPPDSPKFTLTLTELVDADPDNVKEGGIVHVADTYGSSSGAEFTFPRLSLHVAGALTYYYFKITEAPLSGAAHPGWLCDPAVCVLTVEVKSYTDGTTARVVGVAKYSGGVMVSEEEYDSDKPFTYSAVGYVNEYAPETGDLTIQKAFDGFPGDWDIGENSFFSARVKDVATGKYVIVDSNYNYIGAGATGSLIKFSASEPATLKGLPAGRAYEVEEEGSSPLFSVSYSGNLEAFTKDGATVVVTNDYVGAYERLVIKKALAGAYAAHGVNNSTEFTVRVKGPDGKYLLFDADNEYIGEDAQGTGTGLILSASKRIILTGLPEGEYTVEEEGGANFTASYDKEFVSNNDTVTVTNTYDPPGTPPTPPNRPPSTPGRPPQTPGDPPKTPGDPPTNPGDPPGEPPTTIEIPPPPTNPGDPPGDPPTTVDKPPPPRSNFPQTGIGSHLTSFALMLIASLISVAILLILVKREKSKEEPGNKAATDEKTE